MWHAVILIFALSQGTSTPQPSPVPEKQAFEKPEGRKKKITVKIEGATLTEALEEISKQVKFNYVTDAYVNDTFVTNINIEEAPLEVVIPQLADIYGRNATLLNGVVVFRDSRWVSRNRLESNLIKAQTMGWKGEGSYQASRYNGEGLSESAAVNFQQKANKKKPLQFPAAQVDIQAKRISIGKFLQRFTKTSGWTAGIEFELAERRISVGMNHVTPAQVIEAITYLVNAKQKLTIEQSEDQKLLDMAQLDHRLERQKLSDALTEKLLSQLSKEQKEALAMGKEVPISLKSLPPELRDLASDYIRQSAQGMNPPFNLDISKIGDSNVVFLPPPSSCLGADAYLPDGTILHF